MVGALLTLCLAAPPGAVVYDPPKPRLGDLVVLYVPNTDVSIDRGHAQILGYEVPVFRVSASELRAVAAVPTDIEPGSYPVRVFLGTELTESTVEVIDRPFETDELHVSRRFTQKKSKALRARLRREARQFHALWEADPTSPMHVGRLLRPIPGEKTASFGVRRIFNGKRRSTHYGLDLDGDTGDPIRAVADGRVALSAMRWASGGTIVLDHGGGLFTLYFHMSRRDRKVGELVKKGDILGAVGKTGRVTGPHLHLAVVVRSVRLSGEKTGQARSMYVDPERFLQLDFRGHPAFVRPGPGRAQIADKH